MSKAGKCIVCGKNPDKCDDRYDMYGQIIGEKKWKPMDKKVKMVWANAWKISKELADESD